MKLRPLHNRIVVRPKAADEVSAGGIVIPDSASEKPAEGEVIAVGKGKYLQNGKLDPVEVQVGDRVLYSRNVGQEIQVEGETLLVMTDDEILTVVEV